MVKFLIFILDQNDTVKTFLLISVFYSMSLLFASIVFIIYLFFNKNKHQEMEICSIFEKQSNWGKVRLAYLGYTTFIPNRIYILLGSNNYFLMIIKLIVLLLLTAVHPTFIILFAIRVYFAFSSLLFVFFYESSIIFRGLICKYAFEDNVHDMEFLLNYCYGNMWKAGATRLTATAVTASAYGHQRSNENIFAQLESERRTKSALSASGEVLSTENILKLCKKGKDTILVEECALHKAEKVTAEVIRAAAFKVIEVFSK
jgi:hypothetical protein